jgi:phage-related protein
VAQLVGDAYVRIFADTHALRRAIDRDVKKIGADAGKNLGDSLLENFGDTINKQADARLRRYQRTLADSIAGGDFSRMLKQHGGTIDEFVSGIRKDLEGFEEKGYFKKVAGNAYDFEQALHSLDTWADKTRVAEQIKRTEQAMRDLTKTQIDQEKAWASYGRNVQHSLDTISRAQRDQEKAWLSYGKNVEFSLNKTLRAQIEQEKAWVTYGRNLVATSKRVVETDNSFKRYANTLDRTVILLNRHSVATGKMFGAGSRNNFFNFIGQFVSGLASIPAVAMKGLVSVAEGISGIVEQFQGLQKEGMSAFGALRAVGGTLLSGVLPAFLSAVVAIGAMSQIIPVAITLLAHLAGALAAVAGAVGIGLVGGLLALLPLIPAVVAGLGGIALALTGISDTSKKMQKRLEPLTKSFTNLRKALAEDFLIKSDKLFSRMKDTIKSITPFLKDMNTAVINAADRMFAMFQNPAMKPFLKAWGESLPRIFSSLADGVVSLGGALTAFFKPILPYAERLASMFDKAMRTFLDWSVSAKGQNSIAEFMKKAWVYGGLLWDILKNVGSILGSIFTAGAEGPGKSFLQWLKDVTGEWAAFLNTPAGQQKLKDFFTEVGKTMKGIRDFVGEITSGFADTDWKQAAIDLRTTFDGLVAGAKGIATVFDQVAIVVERVRTMFKDYPNPFENFPKFMEHLAQDFDGDVNEFIADLPGSLQRINDAIGEWVTGTLGPGLLEGLHIVNDQIGEWAGSLGTWVWEGLHSVNDSIGEWVTGTLGPSLGEWLSSLPGIIGEALSGVWQEFTQPFRDAWNTLFGNSIVPDIVNAVPEWLGRIPGLIGAALSGVWNALTAPFSSGWNGVVTWLGQIVSAVPSYLTRVPGSIAGALSTVVTTLSTPFSQGWAGILKWLQTTVAGIPNYLRGVPGSIAGALSGVLSAFTGPFSSAYTAISGWIAKIREMVSGAWSWMTSLDLNPFSSLAPPRSGAPSGGPGPRGAGAGGGSGDPFGLSRFSGAVKAMTRPVQASPSAAKIINIAEGAIVVRSNAKDASIVAQQVVDRIATSVTL